MSNFPFPSKHLFIWIFLLINDILSGNFQEQLKQYNILLESFLVLLLFFSTFSNFSILLFKSRFLPIYSLFMLFLIGNFSISLSSISSIDFFAAYLFFFFGSLLEFLLFVKELFDLLVTYMRLTSSII